MERYTLTHFGASQPHRRNVSLHPDVRYRADAIRTWNRTVTERPGTHEGDAALPLLGRPYMAVRPRALEV